MTLKLVSGFCLGLSLGGCMKHPQQSEAAMNVKVLVKSEPVSGCKELGDVTTGNDWMGNVEDVKTYLRNAAAERGANVLTVDVIEKEKTGGSTALYKGSGRAFLCQGEH